MTSSGIEPAVLMHKDEDISFAFILTILFTNKQTNQRMKVLWNVKVQNQRTHALFGQCLQNHNEQVGKYFVNLHISVFTASEIFSLMF